MYDLPLDILILITKYLGCFELKYKISCNLLKNINDCKIVSFNSIKQCTVCGDKDMVSIIKNFSSLGKNPNSIHFANQRLLEKSLPYIYQYFGSISHKCCDGKGVMLLSHNFDKLLRQYKL